MRPEIAIILEEFERLSLDDRIYLNFINDEEIPVQVLFSRVANGRSWSIWYPLSESASKQTVSRIHFPLVLRAFGISDTEFERELGGIFLTQAAFADEFVRQVSQLFGAEAVRKSISQTQNFMNELSEAFPRCAGEADAVASLTPVGAGSNASATEELTHCETDKKSRFRVVKIDS